MQRIIGLVIIVLWAIVPCAAAAPAELPKILKDGFEQYAKTGPKAALEVWTRGSAIEGSKESLSQANGFQQIQDFYGKYVGYTVIRSQEHSASSAVYLIEMKYEKGNVFAKFFTYKKPDNNLAITTFKFHTDAEAVWPESLVLGCGE